VPKNLILFFNIYIDMITNFNLFLERISDVNFRNVDYDTLYKKSNFQNNANLLQKIHLDKYDKDILLNWYDTEIHDFKDKIKNRTSANSISEFNDIVEKSLQELFDKNIDDLLVKMSDKDVNEIAVRISMKTLTYLIIQYNVDVLCSNRARMTILSVVPYVNKYTTNRIFN
jgi:hypothetical protein